MEHIPLPQEWMGIHRLFIGSGQIVHARSSEGTSDTHDNSGNEIRVQPYYNGNWNVVLRYAGEDSASVETTKEYVPTGTTGKGVAALQGLLLYLGYNLGTFGRHRDGVDGDSGSYTNNAAAMAISSGRLTEDELNLLLSLNKEEENE